MRSARTNKTYNQPQFWQSFTQGDSLHKACEAECNRLASRMFGYHLVKLGPLSDAIQLTDCSIRNQVTLHNGSAKPNVKALNTELPLQGNSVDAFFLTLELDFSADPHRMLREIDHSITCDGHILLCGLNPLSLSGIMKLLPLSRNNPLKQGRFFSPMRVKDWLQLLHYEIVEETCFYYRNVFSNWTVPINDKTAGFASQHLSPYLGWSGAAYCILAKKQTIPMTKIKSKRRAARKFVPLSAANPANSVVSPVISPSSQAAHRREVLK